MHTDLLYWEVQWRESILQSMKQFTKTCRSYNRRWICNAKWLPLAITHGMRTWWDCKAVIPERFHCFFTTMPWPHNRMKNRTTWMMKAEVMMDLIIGGKVFLEQCLLRVAGQTLNFSLWNLSVLIMVNQYGVVLKTAWWAVFLCPASAIHRNERSAFYQFRAQIKTSSNENHSLGVRREANMPDWQTEQRDHNVLCPHDADGQKALKSLWHLRNVPLAMNSNYWNVPLSWCLYSSRQYACNK